MRDLEGAGAHFFLIDESNLPHFLILNSWIEEPPIEDHYYLMGARISLASLEVGAEEHLAFLTLQVALSIKLVHFLAELDHDVYL